MTLRNGGNMFSNDFIKATLVELQHNLEETKKSIAYVRDVCQHTDVTIVHGANTGNLCPEDDQYWTNHTCNICGKKWTTRSE